MYGRTVDKVLVETKLQEKLQKCPEFMTGYYYYLAEKTHMTKKRYITTVIRFLTHVGNGDIMNVTEDDLKKINSITIQSYMMSISFIGEGKELKAESKAIIYASINSFLSYLHRTDIIQKNPFDNHQIQRPKLEDNEITFLEPEEYAIVKARIMNGVGSHKAQAKQRDWRYRDLLLFQIPIITGVRVTALSEITMNDIDMENRTIHVIDKNREKTLYFDEETYHILNLWIAKRHGLMKGKPSNPYLFISGQRKKMNPESIRNVVAKYTQDLEKHITPHKLRSTCGTNLYRATGDIYLVAEVLGHKSPATTRKYTKVGNEDRVNAATLLGNRMNQQ